MMNEQKCYVTLRTACGCTSVREWFKNPGPQIIVPLPGRSPDLSQLHLFEPPPTTCEAPRRVFEYRGQKTVNGVLFYEYHEEYRR